MIHYKTAEEIEYIRKSSLLVSETLAALVEFIKPGQTTQKIDEIAETFINDHQAKPAFKGYKGFPGTLCISINEEIVHGIPSKREIKEGDIVSVDCGVKKDGYFGDSAFTFPVGKISEESKKLLRITLNALYLGIEKAVVGNRIGDISYAIQEYTQFKNNYGVVRDLIGHGVGRNLHEEPDVPNYGRRGKGLVLKDGLTIAIEPMINLGTHEVKVLNDNWTIVTRDGKPSAHFEHTIVVGKGKAEILSDHNLIFEAIKKSDYISDF